MSLRLEDISCNEDMKNRGYKGKELKVREAYILSL